jgi:hypothetical protein
VLKQAGSLGGKTVITCSLPMSKDDSHLVVGLSTSGAETIANKAAEITRRLRVQHGAERVVLPAVPAPQVEGAPESRLLR